MCLRSYLLRGWGLGSSSTLSVDEGLVFRRRALTMVELLIAVVIVVILLGIALPTILYVRESSRRAACQSNLHQIGLAVLQYEQIHGQLPPGRDAAEGRDHSWITRILPQLELMGIYERYDFSQPWNDSAISQNRTLAETNLMLFQCPSTIHNVRGASDYGGNYGSSLSGLKKGFGIGLAWDSGVLVALNTPSKTAPRTDTFNTSHVLDGTTHTFLVMEDSGRTEEQGGQWTAVLCPRVSHDQRISPAGHLQRSLAGGERAGRGWACLDAWCGCGCVRHWRVFNAGQRRGAGFQGASGRVVGSGIVILRGEMRNAWQGM